MARIAPAIERAAGPLTEELRRAVRAPALTISLAIRIAIAIGIAFVMVWKPERPEAFAVIAIAATFGAVTGWAIGMRRTRNVPQPSTN
jgi:hypothetical protein